MKVQVIDREEMSKNWGNGLFSFIIRTLEIPDTCDVCGGLRGEPKAHYTYEYGATAYPDVWHNPCGHVDKYRELVKRYGINAQMEAEQL